MKYVASVALFTTACFGGSPISLVLDTSGSMNRVLNDLKNDLNGDGIADALEGHEVTLFGYKDYADFDDTYCVKQLLTNASIEDIRNLVNDSSTFVGGGDNTEAVITALGYAIRHSPEGSYIVFVTDSIPRVNTGYKKNALGDHPATDMDYDYGNCTGEQDGNGPDAITAFDERTNVYITAFIYDGIIMDNDPSVTASEDFNLSRVAYNFWKIHMGDLVNTTIVDGSNNTLYDVLAGIP